MFSKDHGKLSYRETIPTRLRIFGRISLAAMLLNSIIALWIWQVALGLFLITEFFTLVASMGSSWESTQEVDQEIPWVFGLSPRGVVAAMQMLVFLTAVLAWARAINSPIDHKELVWIIGGEFFFAAMSYLFGKIVDY